MNINGDINYLLATPQVGIEPTTHRLTADCSTTELLRKKLFRSTLQNSIEKKRNYVNSKTKKNTLVKSKKLFTKENLTNKITKPI